MKFLKLILFSILMNTTLIIGVIAQINEAEETYCTEKVPALQISSINDDQIEYNRDDFADFKDVKLLVFQPDEQVDNIELNCYNLQIDFGRTPASNGTWIVVIDGEIHSRYNIKKCEEYFFKIEASCEGNTIFSDCANYFFVDESCSEISGNDFAIHPQPATKFIYIDNFSRLPIESINILDMQGHKMLVKKNNMIDNKFEIQFQGIISGVHIVKIVTLDKSTFFKKLIIQN